ncbi:MAG: MATE family efflux transporter [Eubacteriales bacterium]|nr:MATE family efflux transporter [Eubacteriales bacterium]
MKKSYGINMCEGAILPKLCLFAIPLILSSVLQLLFNAADVIVVGRFSGSQSLAAVGSTTSLILLLVNLFLGVSIGTNVLAARYYGAKDEEAVQETVHTAILVALLGGIAMVFLGLLCARPVLTWMGTPEDVIQKSVLYMSIYFCGMPGFMVYNFGAAILRAIGDTRRPLYFLMITGVVNVALNLCFVILLHLDVAGVALATISAQYLSAVFVVRCLCQTEDMCHLDLHKLRIYKNRLVQMMRIGVAAGFQSVVFNISNVLIQSSINSFGSLVMAGNTAASNIEGFVYVSMNSVTQTALSFTSQNLGAQQYKRIDQIVIRCLAMVAAIGLTLGLGAYFLGNHLLYFYTSNPKVVEYGLFRLSIIAASYFLCGLMDVMAGTIRGLGYSALPTIVSLIGACAFRILWIFTIFQIDHTRFCLYVSYPISWFLTALAHFCCYFWVRHRVFPKQ